MFLLQGVLFFGAGGGGAGMGRGLRGECGSCLFPFCTSPRRFFFWISFLPSVFPSLPAPPCRARARSRPPRPPRSGSAVARSTTGKAFPAAAQGPRRGWRRRRRRPGEEEAARGQRARWASRGSRARVRLGTGCGWWRGAACCLFAKRFLGGSLGVFWFYGVFPTAPRFFFIPRRGRAGAQRGEGAMQK